MEMQDAPDLQVLLEHISRFIEAVPSTSDQSADWTEIQTLRYSAVDSLQRLQGMAGMPLEGSGSKCQGAIPKQ